MHTIVSVKYWIKHWVAVGIVKRIDLTASYFFPWFLATVFPILLFSEYHLSLDTLHGGPFQLLPCTKIRNYAWNSNLSLLYCKTNLGSRLLTRMKMKRKQVKNTLPHHPVWQLMLCFKPADRSYFCFILFISETVLANIALGLRMVYWSNSVTPWQCTDVQDIQTSTCQRLVMCSWKNTFGVQVNKLANTYF